MGLSFLYLNMQLAILILVAVLCKHGNAMEEQEVPGKCQSGRKQTGNQESGDYIINGQPADINEYPWMVLLLNKTIVDPIEPLCGGSLISNQWILTAAHCTPRGVKASDIQVVLGLDNLLSVGYESRRNIVEIIKHPNFQWLDHPPPIGLIKADYDFALLKMQKPVDFITDQHIRPICLPTNPSTQYEDAKAIATGWGRITNCEVQYPFPNKLQEINLEVLSNRICREYINNIPITSQSICANVPGQVGGTARGDSGGPLIVDAGGYYELVGVTSWGKNDCVGTPALPTVFARVTSIIGWIKENIQDDWTSCTKK